jgi:hypothetical protein
VNVHIQGLGPSGDEHPIEAGKTAVPGECKARPLWNGRNRIDSETGMAMAKNKAPKPRTVRSHAPKLEFGLTE